MNVARAIFTLGRRGLVQIASSDQPTALQEIGNSNTPGKIFVIPEVAWWVTSKSAAWTAHQCVSMYVYAAALHRQGKTNIIVAIV